MMRLRYAVVCDYAQSGAFGKPTIVGVHEVIMAPDPSPGESIRTSPGFLHSMIDGPTSMGPKHVLTNRLIDADANEIFSQDFPITFIPKHANPASQFIYTYGFIHPIDLPSHGDYEWTFSIDGLPIGAIPFSVIPFPKQQPQST